ncbi:MAG: lamin tail domain-containing protein [Crocinitomicaceae bacterium]
MRYILTAYLLSVTFFNYAQLVDDFSDGDFSSNPLWTGESPSFEVDGNGMLHLIAPAVTDTMFLVTSSTLVDNAEWSFLVNLDFNPSSSNLARIYLMSDQNSLEQGLNGYFVQIGNTTDEVSLYKQTGTAITEIIDGTDDVVDSDPVLVRVKVTRTAAGEWTLQVDNTGNLNFVNQGTVTDITHTSATYFGVFCKYTSTRSDKFYFDDFKVEPLEFFDTIPPQITGVDVVSDQILHLSFTENVDVATASNPSNYSANNGLGSPSQAQPLSTNGQIVELTYSSPFQNGVDYTLSVENVEDDSSNVMPNSTVHFMYNEPYFANYKDVVISELMADPTPVLGQPESEYIEIFNNTNQTISLENWTISDGSTTVTLSDYSFFSKTYLLCYDPGQGVNYGIFNTIETNLPSLNNLADVIILRDNNGMVVDSVAYKVGWYNSISKATGGWSLELKNLESPCHDPNNWSASEDVSGGTPGYENSIATDSPNTEKPRVVEAFVVSNSAIHFVFDKNIEGGSVTINPIPNIFLDVQGNELIVSLSNINAEITYELTVSGFKDCWGNEMNDFMYLFAIPKSIESGDVLINEVLFNPEIGGSDYVEIVNTSEKVIALNDLQIANIDDGVIDNIKLVAEKQILFFPGEYKLLTEDTLAVIETFPNYKAGTLFEIDLPSYNNDSGTVILLHKNGVDLIDKFSYTEELHFALIDDLNGKALERLSFSQTAEASDNWHTASEAVGWGTPGYLNSQTTIPVFDKDVQLSQPIFSPDSDGYQDVLELTYQFDNPDNVMDITVYNAFGQPIKELKDNFYPGNKGVIVWDGTTDNGTKANVGTYIVGVTVFDLSGNVKRYKLVGVLAAKL